MKLSASQIVAIGAVGLAGFVVYQGSRTVARAANAINPVNNDNIIARGFDATLEKIGVLEKGSSFGSAIYDFFHPTYDPNQGIRGPLQ